MSADDKQFLDLLGNIPQHLQKYTDEVAGYIDVNVDRAAGAVRETLANATWLPDYVRPNLPVQSEIPVVILTPMERVQGWVSRNKILTGVMVAACGVVIFEGYQKTQSLRKTRRAKRAKNGGRTEVVVIAGSPTLPLTKSLSLDMERRGFIVFVVCSASEDEDHVAHFARPDIKPLYIDTADPPLAGTAIERFATYLQSPHAPVPNMKPNQLSLRSVILIPSLNYQTSPIATIPPSSFADLFQTHLLQPILTIQAFLPLLTTRLRPTAEDPVKPKVLVFTPSIISSLNPPFHAPEATVCSALSAFTEVLTAELRPLDIPVTHMQLGTFDFSGFVPSRHHTTSAGNPSETLVWPDDARHAYGRNFVAQTSSAISGARIRGFKGSSLKRLHNSVFDVIDGSITTDTVRIGLGASVYGFVGRWAPRTLVSWLMGIRRVDELSAWKNPVTEESSASQSDDGETSASTDFIAVPSESNVWTSDRASTIWVSEQP
ncbi:Putative DUF1776 family protein [[Torrubiella] hemipterigena]|uniref:Putative DUF1776 family protein n=1 Tax=[Torrubiella] hemipterigena TaxID=1531966 RepID=A0A0A1TH96_9HYPO|nr:Putative DUF1776 family protein [[Torrubiella] hemipterigena]